jgi:hypothetical protein
MDILSKMEFHPCDIESDFKRLFDEFNSDDPLLNRNIIATNIVVAELDKINEEKLLKKKIVLVKTLLNKLMQMYSGAEIFSYMYRDNFTKTFSWAIPDVNFIMQIIEFVGEDELLEVGAGTGFLLFIIKTLGGKVVSTDLNYLLKVDSSNPNSEVVTSDQNSEVDTSDLNSEVVSSEKKYVDEFWPPECNFNNPFLEMDIIDAKDAVMKYPTNALFICWPNSYNDCAFDALKEFKGNKFIYIGEAEGGCCGTHLFFNLLKEEWNLIKKINIPRWRGNMDNLYFYERKLN